MITHKPFDDGWHDVERQSDMPFLHRRCLFQMKDFCWKGFRFYGERIDAEQVRMLLTGKVVPWVTIKRWQDASLR